MKNFGLLGKNIDYSFSRGYFKDKFDFKSDTLFGCAIICKLRVEFCTVIEAIVVTKFEARTWKPKEGQSLLSRLLLTRILVNIVHGAKEVRF